MGLREPGGAERFANKPVQAVMAAISGSMAVLGLVRLTEPEQEIQGAVFLIIGTLLLIHALRSTVVLVDDAGVCTRSTIGTRRYRFDELDRAVIAASQSGFHLSDRQYLVLERSDGRAIAFTELNAPTRKSGAPTVVTRAVNSINARLGVQYDGTVQCPVIEYNWLQERILSRPLLTGLGAGIVMGVVTGFLLAVDNGGSVLLALAVSVVAWMAVMVPFAYVVRSDLRRRDQAATDRRPR